MTKILEFSCIFLESVYLMASTKSIKTSLSHKFLYEIEISTAANGFVLFQSSIKSSEIYVRNSHLRAQLQAPAVFQTHQEWEKGHRKAD